MEVHTHQKRLPDNMMNLKELDDRNMSKGTFNVSCVIQSIQESKIYFKQSLLQTFGSSSSRNNKNLQKTSMQVF